MKKSIFYPLFALAAFIMIVQSSPVEASRNHFQVGVSNRFPYREAHIIRTPIVPAPVYVQQPGYYDQYGRYYPPVYVAVPQPIQYVEQVYVTPVRRPPVFGGVSFSWNWFR